MRLDKRECLEATKKVMKAYFPRDKEDVLLMKCRGGKLTLAAKGPKMGIEYTFDAKDDNTNDFECMIAGRRFASYISLMEGDDVCVEYNKGALNIKAGRQEVKMRCIRDQIEQQSFAEMKIRKMGGEPVGALHIPEQVLGTCHAIGDYRQNFQLACVCLEYTDDASRVTACNMGGVSMRSDMRDGERTERKIVLFGPLFLEACRMLGADPKFRVLISKEKKQEITYLIMDDGNLAIYLIAETHQFFNLEAVVSHNMVVSAKMPRKDILNAMEMAAFTEKDQATMMLFQENGVSVKCASMFGEYNGFVSAEVEGATPNKLFFTANLMREALDALAGSEVIIQDNGMTKPIYIYGHRGVEIVMPRTPLVS